jgi:hypothetical protein
MLREIEKDHWVGLWRTSAVVNNPTRTPDLAFTYDRGKA